MQAPRKDEGGRTLSGRTVVARDNEGNLLGHLEDRSHLGIDSTAAVLSAKDQGQANATYSALESTAKRVGIKNKSNRKFVGGENLPRPSRD